MTRALPARFGFTAHAIPQIRRRQFVIGGVFICLGLASFASGLGASLSLPLIFMGAAVAGLGRLTAELGEAAQVLNRATNAASSGHLNDASELLDYAEETYRHRYVRRGIDLQWATMAMHRGDLEEARRRADAAILRPRSLSLREHERLQITAAHALRALLRASSGDPEGAQADIEIVRKSPHTTPDSLARAELAAALLLERAGNLEALREHLTSERALLLEHTRLRERAIVRAYQQMLAKATTIYRTSAPRDPVGAEEPELADWAAKLSPGVTPFLHASRPSEILVIDDKARAAAERRFEPAGGSQRVFLLLFIILPMIGLAIWQGLTPKPSTRAASEVASPVEDKVSFYLTFMLVAFPIVIGLAFALSLRVNRDARRLRLNRLEIARGNDGAIQDLARLGKSGAPVIAAEVHLSLAEFAERRGELPDALAECEAALGSLKTKAARDVAAEVLLPSIYAERAFLFAAMDRSSDAHAEIALLAERYPSYRDLDKARFRVVLVQRARHGAIADAATVAEQTADLSLSARDELLARLVCAVASPGTAGADEVERLREEIGLQASRRWLTVVAPAVLEAFSHAAVSADGDAEEGGTSHS